jgi:hypothetical protein
MEPQQLAELSTGATGIFILIILALWAILTFNMPFRVYSIMASNKELLNINIQMLAELQGKGPIEKRKHVEPTF